MNVPLYFREGRDEALIEAVPLVRETLLSGGTVLVHCNKCFHRGPALAAAETLLDSPGGDAAAQTSPEAETLLDSQEGDAETYAEAAPPEQGDSSTARARMTATQQAEERARGR